MRSKNKISISVFVALSLILVGAFSVQGALESQEDISIREKKSREGYLVDLKQLIKRSKKQIDKVGDKIEEQARLRRNQQRELKAREYYEKAMRLYEEGNFDKARDYWDKSIKITEHKEMKGYIRESVKKTKKQNEAFEKEERQRLAYLELERGYDAKDVDKKYENAVKLYKDGKYLEAKVDFDDVEDMFPDHKATRSYLMVIDQEIEKEQQRLIEEKLRQDAIVKGKEKEAWRRELEEKERDRQKKLRLQAEEIYQRALSYYKKKDFRKAKEQFQEVEWILPDYKSTIKYLSRIDKEIDTYEKKEEQIKEKELARQIKNFQTSTREEKLGQGAPSSSTRARSTKANLKELYKEAKGLYGQKLYRQAQAKFYQIQDLGGDYRSTGRYLKKIEKIIGQEQDARIARSVKGAPVGDYKRYFNTVSDDEEIRQAIEDRYQQFADKAEEKYAQGLTFYDQQNFVEAKRKFIEAEAIYPDYKKTRSYLSRIDEDIAEYNALSQEKRESYRPPKIVEDKTYKAPAAKLKQEKVAQKKQPKKKRVKDPSIDQMDKKERLEEAEINYKKAMKYYRSKEFKPAVDYFTKANNYVEGYKLSDKYVDYINRLIKKDTKMLKETASAKGIENLRAKDKKAAKDREKEAKKARLNRDRIESEKIKKKIKQLDKNIEDHQTDAAKERIQKADVLYEEALALYKEGKYLDAKMMFSTVYTLEPGYKSAGKYINRCEEILFKEDEKKKKERQKMVDRRVKQREQLEKDREKRRKSIDKVAIKRRKAEVDKAISDALEVYKLGDYSQARERFSKVDKMLATGGFTTRYIKGMQKKIFSQKKEVERIKLRAQEKESQVKEKEEMLKAKRKAAEDKLKKKEAAVKAKEEAKLARKSEKPQLKREEEPLKPVKTVKKKTEIKQDILKSKSKVVDEKTSADEKKIMESIVKKEKELERIKKKLDKGSKKVKKGKKKDIKMAKSSKSTIDLEKLIIMRQKEIDKERAKVQKEFEVQIEKLYDQAVRLYKQGENSESRRMFEEIDMMKPDYKNTRKYLGAKGKGKKAAKRKSKSRMFNWAKKPVETPMQPKAHDRASIISKTLDYVEGAL